MGPGGAGDFSGTVSPRMAEPLPQRRSDSPRSFRAGTAGPAAVVGPGRTDSQNAASLRVLHGGFQDLGASECAVPFAQPGRLLFCRVWFSRNVTDCRGGP